MRASGVSAWGLSAWLLIVPGVSRAELDLDPDVEIARRHFEEGTRRYERGEYAQAIVEFEEARRLSPRPAFDYNIARCQDRAEQLTAAIESYERFIAASDAASGDVSSARARVALLRSRLAERERRAAAVITAPRPGVRLGLAPPIAVGAIAVATLAVGAGLYASVTPGFDRCRAMADRLSYCSDTELDTLEVRDRAGLGLLIAGGVIAAGDLVLWTLWGRARRASGVDARPLTWLPRSGPGR